MRRKHMLSVFLLSTGVALLVAATAVGVATSATQKSSAAKGGILQISQSGTAFDTLDPQLAYVTNDWAVLDNTQLLLLNFPDKPGAAGSQLFPEAATAFPTISKDGKTYTFHIRSGLKFDTGAPVTAANFERAFERILSPQMYAQYGTFDQIDQFVVGGQAFAQTGDYAKGGPKYTANPPQTISGITAKGLTLTIHLTKPVPQFSSILAMQWFGAIPANLPYAKSKSQIEKFASAGPYYISSDNLTSLVVLKKNPYWHGVRPANTNEIIIHVYPSSNGQATLLQTEKGQDDLDIGGVPSVSVAGVISKYGVNKKNGQFHVGPTSCVNWYELNNGIAPTNNLAVRKAVNYALSRNELIGLAGPDSGSPSDQFLVPGIPGYSKFTTYSANADLATAKSVGGSALSGANMNVLYNTASTYQTNAATYIQHQLESLGMKPTLQAANTDDYYSSLETKSTAENPSTGYNIGWGGWCADYFDPFDYFNVNLDGRTIQDTGNVDYFYFNNSTFDNQMDAAAAKSGTARSKAYATLDKDLMTKYVPFVPYEVGNSRYLTSKRVGNWIYSNYFGSPDLNALTVG